MADIARARVPVVFDPAQIKKDADAALKEGAAGTALRVPVALDQGAAQQAKAELESSLRGFGGLTAEQQAPLVASQVKLNDVLSAPLEEAGEVAQRTTGRFAGLGTALALVGRDINPVAGTLGSLAATELNAAASTGSLSAALGPAGLVVAGVAAVGVLAPLVAGLLDTNHALLDDAKAAKELQGAFADLGKNPASLDKTLIGQLTGPDATTGTKKLYDQLTQLGIPVRAFLDEVEKGSSSLGTLAKSSSLHDFTGDLELNATNAKDLHDRLVQAASGGDRLAQSLVGLDLSNRQTYQSVVDLLRGTNEFSGNTETARRGFAALSDALRSVPVPVNLQATADALKGVTDAESGLLQAQGNLAATQLNAASAPLKVADAQARLRDAQREATSGIADQERALTDAVNSASVRLRKAQEAADEVTFAQERAHIAIQQQEAEITVAQATREALRARTPDEQLAAQKNLLSAQDQLASASKSQAKQAETEADARQAVVDATDALTEAQHKQADFAATVADKQRAVAEAELNVEQAQINAATAATDLRVQQDRLNGVTDSAYTKSKLLGDELALQARSAIDGPVHDGLNALITDYGRLETIITSLVGQQETLKGTNKPGDLSGVDFSASIPAAPTHAAGGWTSGGAANFAEQGYEIGLFPNAGVYNTPPGQIINHGDSVALLQGLAGGGVAQRERPNVYMTVVTSDARRGVREAMDDIAHRVS